MSTAITMQARFSGSCRACRGTIKVGETMRWVRDTRSAYHADCLKVDDSAPAAPEPIKVQYREASPRGFWFSQFDKAQIAARTQVKSLGWRFHPQQCETRCWACKTGVPHLAWWSDDAAKVEPVRGACDEAGVAALDAVREADAASRASDAQTDVPCPQGLAYLPFQRAGIEWLRSHPRTLLADEMGLGKTIQALGLVNSDEAIRRTLVICPATLRRNWVREASKWLVRPSVCRVVEDASALASALADSTDKDMVVSVNYEKLIKGRGQDLLARLREVQWDLVVVDEAHRAKNPKAQQTKAILGVPAQGRGSERVEAVPGLVQQATRAILASGSPLPNKPVEMFPLLSALQPAIWSNFFAYAKRYCDARQIDAGRRLVWDFSGASHLDELQRRLRTEGGGTMIRRLKADVLTELPPKRRQLVVLEPNGCSAMVERERERAEEMEETVAAAQAAAEVARLSGDNAAYEEAAESLRKARKMMFDEISRLRHDNAVAKAPYVAEHVVEMLESVDKVVVFAHHHDVTDSLVAAFADYGVVRLDGRDSADDRTSAVDRFQQDPSCRVIVASIMAAGVGITLTAASNVVFAELDFVPANIQQAEDRCHRIGQVDTVNALHLVFDGSIDQRMAEILINKMDVADRALDRRATERPPVELDATYASDRLFQHVSAAALDEAEANRAAPKQVRDAKRGAGLYRDAHTYSPEVKAALHEAIVRLAEDCDYARTRDTVGFSAQWVSAGHWLAARPTFDDSLAQVAVEIVRYHQKQVGEELCLACGIQPKAILKAKKAKKGGK